jgi:hypothetical protein
MFLALAICMGAIIGCDDDDDNGTNGGTDPVIVTIVNGSQSEELNLRDLSSIEVEGYDVVFLNNLISETIVPPWYDNDSVAWDTRPLHGYRTIGADGFNPYTNRGYQDCYWDWLSMGYIFVESRDVQFPDELIDLPGAFNVDDTETIEVRRMLKVTVPFDSFMVEFDEITPTTVLNPDSIMESALPLADFVPDTIITLGPENYQYKIVAIDGFTQNDPLTWEQMQVGYWLLDSEKTWFLADSIQSSRYKIKAAEHIEVF